MRILIILIIDPRRWRESVVRFSSVQFSRSIMSNSLQLHGLQQARLPCPSPILGACSNSCPSSWWCHATIYVLGWPKFHSGFPVTSYGKTKWTFLPTQNICMFVCMCNYLCIYPSVYVCVYQENWTRLSTHAGIYLLIGQSIHLSF